MSTLTPAPPYGTYTLQYKRGDNFRSEFIVTQADGVTPENITGWLFTMTVDTLEDPPDDSSNLFSVAGVIVDAAAGRVGFTPTPANTDLPKRTYFYDIQAIDGAGNKRTIVKDRFEIRQDITKT